MFQGIRPVEPAPQRPTGQGGLGLLEPVEPSSLGEQDMTAVTTLDGTTVASYYRAAVWALRRLDDVGVPPKRFDSAAEARWTQFQGNLTWSHRIDLLMRDASARFGPAFQAGTIFDLPGLAIDEPFGPSWPSLRPQQARELWNEAKKAPATEAEPLVALWAEILKVAAPGKAAFTRPGPAEQLVAVGPTAAWKVFNSFVGQTALDWSRGVHVFADTPAGRQFAGLLAVVDPAPGATRLVGPTGGDETGWLAELRSGTPRVDRIVGPTAPTASEKAALAALREAFPSASVESA